MDFKTLTAVFEVLDDQLQVADEPHRVGLIAAITMVQNMQEELMHELSDMAGDDMVDVWSEFEQMHESLDDLPGGRGGDE